MNQNIPGINPQRGQNLNTDLRLNISILLRIEPSVHANEGNRVEPLPGRLTIRRVDAAVDHVGDGAPVVRA